VHLRRVADGTRRDEERDHQGEGVQGESRQLHEAESPDRRQAARDRRPQRAAPVAEVAVEEDPREDHGAGERQQHLPLEGEDPAVLPGLTGDEDRNARVRERQDRFVDGREEAPGVEPALGEAGADEGGALVQGDQIAEDVARAEHEMFDLPCLGLGRDGSRHERITGHAPPALDLHDANEPAPDRVDLIVVDAGKPIHRLGGAQDGRQDVGREDGAAARLDHHRQHVRFAEVFVETIVDLHEGVSLRKQVAGTEVELQPDGESREDEGQRDDGADHEATVGDQPGTETGHATPVTAGGSRRRQARPVPSGSAVRSRPPAWTAPQR
jgi:hypothetical protein